MSNEAKGERHTGWAPQLGYGFVDGKRVDSEEYIAFLETERKDLRRVDYVCQHGVCEAFEYGGLCRCAALSNELPALERQLADATAALAEAKKARTGWREMAARAEVMFDHLSNMRHGRKSVTDYIFGARTDLAELRAENLEADARLDVTTVQPAGSRR
jgi:hypothetical protein